MRDADLSQRQQLRAARALKRALAAAGGGTPLARALSRKAPITSQAIYQWIIVPAARAKHVSKLTGVPLHELRPDLWDNPERGPKRASGKAKLPKVFPVHREAAG